MALFVLREGFRVETTATGGRVVHNRTGDALQLSPLEVQVLARATAWGINPKDPELRPVIRKLSGLGLLKPASGQPAVDVELDFDEPALPAGDAAAAPAGFMVDPASPVAQPASPPQASPPPEPIPTTGSIEVPVAAPATAAAARKPTLEDVVPLFRGELKVTRKGTSSLYDVSDPASGRTFTLYDFELSLARMLTGKRPYSEVIAIGERLGIPVNLESLEQFIRQLERYGFLAPAGAQQPEPQEGSVWAPREKWDEQLRTLFQSGLKMSRQGRYGEAAGYFEAMLQQDPDNPEALEMLTQIQQRLSSDPSLAVVTPTFPDLPMEGVGDLLSADANPPLAVATGAAAPAVVEGARGPRRSMRVPLVAALGCIALAGLGSGAWLALREPPPASPPLELPPVAAESSKPAPARPKPSRPPASPALAAAAPASLQPAEDAAPPPAPAPEPAAAEPAPTAPAAAEPSPPESDSTEKAPAAAEAKPAPAPVAASNAVTVAPVKRGRVTMAEVTAPADGTVTWKIAAQQPVRRGQVVGTLRIGKRERPLAAGKAGLLMPKVADGGAAEDGDLLAEVVYPEAFLQAHLEGVRPRPNWSCEVLDAASGNTASCKIVTVVARGSGFFVTATTEPLWFDTAAQPRLRLTPQ